MRVNNSSSPTSSLTYTQKLYLMVDSVVALYLVPTFMRSIYHRFLSVSFLALALTFLTSKIVKAATVIYDFTLSPDFGPLVGNIYNGNLSYDDTTLTGALSESVGLSSFNLPFEGSTYTLSTDPTATADFTLSNFLGVDFSASTLTLSQASFFYDVGGFGTGTIVYSKRADTNTTPEPQPLSILGTIAILGLGVDLKRKPSKREDFQTLCRD